MKTRLNKFFCIIALIFCLTSVASAGSELTLNSDRLFDYAVKSYKEGDYAESSSSFHSFIYFFPGDKRKEHAMILRGFSLYSLKRYHEAGYLFRLIFDSDGYGKNARDISGLMTASCLEESGDRASALSFMENWASSCVNDDPFLDRIRYETAWLYLSNDDRIAAEGRVSEIMEISTYRSKELSEELERVPSFEKSPNLAGTLAVFPGAGFAYLGRYSDAFAALAVNSALGAAAWQSFDKDLPALGGIISFVGVGFYLGGIYGSVSAAEKMNRRNRSSFFSDLKTRLYVKDDSLGAAFDINF